MRCLIIFLFSLLLAAAPTLCAQTIYFDDFEDGDFLNPEWVGDTSDFLVQNGQLLQVANNGIIRLETPHAANADTLIFELLILADFPMESGEYCYVNLVTRPGYWMSFRLDRSEEIPMDLTFIATDFDGRIEGAPDPFSGEETQVRIRISRIYNPSSFGDTYNYSLEADYTGGTNFVLVGEALRFFGQGMQAVEIGPRSTTTENRFRFDDLKLYANSRPDTTGPIIESVTYNSFNQFFLRFSDTLDYLDPPPFDELSFDREDVIVDSIQRWTNYGLRVWTQGFLPLREPFEVRITNARDNDGDTTAHQTFPLYYDPLIVAQSGLVVINEFMVDPSPPAGLPEVEYIELRNLSPYKINLSSMSITTGNVPVPLPADTLEPYDYAVFTQPEFVDDFAALGIRAYGVPLDVLANNGDAIILKAGNEVVQRVQYNRSFYTDPITLGNGYSLEYVGEGADPNCPDGWRTSTDPSGGTPGRANTAFGQGDFTPPEVSDLRVAGDTLYLTFSEELDSTELPPSLFAINPDATIFRRVILTDTTIMLLTDVSPGSAYVLTVFAEYADCQGNYPVADQLIPFGQDPVSNPDTMMVDTMTVDTSGMDTMIVVEPPTTPFYLRLDNRTVSPDGDGFEDELILAYGTDAAGYRLRLRVFDVQGRLVRDLGKVDLSTGEGNIVWDGLADNGVWPGRGAYVLVAEITLPGGGREVQKFAVVVAGLR